MTLTIRHPQSEQDFSERNLLLQKTLRKPEDEIPIELDYPLVLHPQFYHRSFCLYVDDKLIAHVNILPRQLFLREEEKTINLAFIGNVTTDPAHRGKGYMQLLMQKVEEHAKKHNMQGLVLWSDLPHFYQKLGFRPFGKELRLTFAINPTSTQAIAHRQHVAPVTKLHFHKGPASASFFSKLRLDKKATILRSQDEVERLLAIPRTHLILKTNGQAVQAYGIFGRGSDMQNVLHEWGCQDPQELLEICRFVMSEFSLDNLLILAPKWSLSFLEQVKNSFVFSEEPVCWFKQIGSQNFGKIENDFFVWGLDSI